ncbi:zinc finger MYM-type protein 1 [Trichonephila clavipes]|uniref:Zinc finger MYM-type protein 1 n=1 Tax=Trichonephila clavipes TaxID=2585209 RepID=A0A8X6VC34_TRICX|nr:zinc finger MYM-type protein 1 [Trichonephila clavipes]
MQNLDYQQPSEKDIVQPEDISNVPAEKYLENVGFEFEKYIDMDKQLKEQLRKDTEYYQNVLKHVVAIVKYLAIRGLAFRGTEEVLGSPHNGNFMGALELLAEFDPFIRERIEQRALRPNSLISMVLGPTELKKLELLAKNFQDRILGLNCADATGQGGEGVDLPGNSLDLNLLDYFLWGYLKYNVYNNHPQSVDVLQQAISAKILASYCLLFQFGTTLF